MIDLTKFSKQVDELIFYLDDIQGYQLYRRIKKEGMHLIQQDREKEGAMLALQFLIIPFLSTRQISDLLKNDLYAGLSLNDIDLTDRITKKLIKLDISDRDNCKKELKRALVSNQEQITEAVYTKSKKKLKTIADWIKNYISNVNKRSGQTLGRAQYLSQKPYFNRLDRDEKEMLKKLFDLYKFLNTSSMTPEGFEDDILIKTKDGRLITTNKGQVITLYDFNKKQGVQIAKPKARTVSGPPKTKTEKRVDQLSSKAQEFKAGSLEEKAVKEEIDEEKNIEKLKYLADKYPIGSLERKAIEDEIRRLKRS